MRQIKEFILPGWFIVLLTVFGSSLADEDQLLIVTIADPFINLHTGPGAAYPIFHVISRGSSVTIIKQRTEWFQISTADGKVGWASRDEMQQTMLPGGNQFSVTEASEDDFVQRRWQYGFNGGEFENAPIVSLYTAYSFTENLVAELSYGHSSGNISGSDLLKINVMIQPFPRWTFSPFFTLGVGAIKVKPSANLISSGRRNSTVSQVGVGIHYYLSRQFILRLEFNQYVIFSAINSVDRNEDISEWKAGFAIFF